MNSACIRAVRFFGVLVGLVLVADLFHSPFDWRGAAARLAISFPLVVPWSLLKRKWAQALAYLLLWVDLILSFGVVMLYFMFGQALGMEPMLSQAALAAFAVFCVCAPSILLMRNLYSGGSGRPIQSPQNSAGSRPASTDFSASESPSAPAPRG